LSYGATPSHKAFTAFKKRLWEQKFKRAYRKRQAIERFFSLIKENFSHERKMKARATKRVRIYVYLIVSSYVASFFTQGFG